MLWASDNAQKSCQKRVKSASDNKSWTDFYAKRRFSSFCSINPDTNVFISYLLTSQQDGVVYTILEAALADQFTLLLPQDLLNEIRVTVTRKPYLVDRIPLDALDALLSVLTSISEEIPRIENPIPPITRDPKDDYLIAYAIVGEAEYLVTGDKDLLVLEEFDAIKVLTPMRFFRVLGRR